MYPIFPDFSDHFQIELTYEEHIRIQSGEAMVIVYHSVPEAKFFSAYSEQIPGESGLFVLPPETSGQLLCPPPGFQQHLICIIRISESLAGSIFSVPKISFKSQAARPDLAALKRLCASIAAGLWQQQQARQAAADNRNLLKKYIYFFQLMDALYPLISFPEEQLPQKAPKALADLLSYIRNHWKENISLHSLAKRAGMSDAALSRAIKKYTGDNFEIYLKKMRLYAAARDLLLTNRTITEIAVDNGFSSGPALNKAFREFLQITPGQYRRQAKGGSAGAPGFRAGDGGDGADVLIFRAGDAGARGFHASAADSLADTADSNSEILNIRADADTSAAALARAPSYTSAAPWQKAINMGMASDFKSGRFQRLFIRQAKEGQFRYVRIYNIFSPEMDFRSGHDCAILNFESLDEVLELILNQGLLPMLELAAKPRIVKKNIYEALLYEDGNAFFLDDAEELAVLEQFFSHLEKKYGAGAEQWLFEYWYDYDQAPDPDEDIYAFLPKFDTIAALIKKYLPKASFGGCGLPLIDFDMDRILKAWASQTIAPDFLSFSYFPYSGRNLQGSPQWMTPWITSTEHINRSCADIKALCQKYFSRELPIYITEWNMSLSNRNYFNDSCEKAALLTHYMLSLSGHIDMIAYYMGNDFTARTYDAAWVVSGASGLITRDGIPKPVHYALRFLSSGPENRLLCRQSGYQVIARGSHFEITGSLPGNFSPKTCDYSENEITESTLSEIFIPGGHQRVCVTITHVPDGFYRQTRHSLSLDHGNLLKEWNHLKLLEPLEENYIHYLEDICRPHITTKIIRAQNHILHVQEDVLPHETVHIELDYMEADR